MRTPVFFLQERGHAHGGRNTESKVARRDAERGRKDQERFLGMTAGGEGGGTRVGTACRAPAGS
jgi:hypothetical protein